jgi:hypothetical protein
MSAQMSPSFRNLDELKDYLAQLENRVKALETENSSLKNALRRLRQNGEMTFKSKADRLPDTALLSDSFIWRALAVWGHYFVAQIIIGIPFFLCYLILMITVLSENIGATF